MLVFISETDCILCDVRTEFLNITMNFMFQNLTICGVRNEKVAWIVRNFIALWYSAMTQMLPCSHCAYSEVSLSVGEGNVKETRQFQELGVNYRMTLK